MKSESIKTIRSLDKDLRDEFKGQSLFQVTFKHLRDASDEEVEEVLTWYLEISTCIEFKRMKKLWEI